MSPALFQFLKRLALVTLLLAALLLVLPRFLTEVGWIGPPPEERVAAAAAALEAARGYGADERIPAFAEASRGLAEARSLLQAGRRREARDAAEAASARAVAAQREGLIRRDTEQRQAQAIVEEADRRLNELEALHSRVSRADKAQAAELLTSMKAARQAGSGLILRYEEDDFARVIADRDAAFQVLAEVRRRLAEAARP